MYSLPFISHHLFVAAIGNEGRVPEKPRPHERPPADLAGNALAVALEVVDGPRPVSSRGTRPLRTAAAQART
jgi:hypothetical protein